MPVFWLTENELTFPHPELANEDGILAVGGDLSVDRLLLAYRIGLFPWFNPEDPILWWSPDPRFVVFPDELKISKSMRPYFNQKKLELSFDQDFDGVIRSCQQQPRKGQNGSTWISTDMIDAYTRLFDLGFAHSVEVWQDGALVGGLYGVALGKCFYGESMFAKVSNASKFGFISLVKHLDAWGYELVDCQQETQHLETLGGRGIPRKDFLKIMANNAIVETVQESWGPRFDPKLIWKNA
ncbi:MAG: leucyl/phenylalanyl-tRNA--protein transferase [Saprospiraceae bacterium]